MAVETLAPRLEAIIFTSDKPAPLPRLAAAVGLIPSVGTAAGKADADDEQGVAPEILRAAEQSILEAIATLNAAYEQTGRVFRIEHVAGGVRVMTLAEHASTVAAFHKKQVSGKLTRAAIETLAIIAYKQPMTRAELEAIRGVACGEVLKTLMERRLVTIKGRAEELGRPILYGTTKAFLDHFGLASVKDLPSLTELKPLA
jgi:segregation and condensation protein B